MLNNTLIKIALLCIIIAFFSITIATYIENTNSVDMAWDSVYRTVWFEVLLYVLAVILVANIVVFKMYKKNKIPAFIFHISFIAILIGAIISKHYGFQQHLESRICSSFQMDL